jgi:quercetin dioxygenase-like cupin family protein
LRLRASFVGQPPWELHNGGDELIQVLAGETLLTVRTGDAEETRLLKAGDVAVVRQGCWHRNDAATGVTAFVMTRREVNEHAWDDPHSA